MDIMNYCYMGVCLVIFLIAFRYAAAILIDLIGSWITEYLRLKRLEKVIKFRN